MKVVLLAGGLGTRISEESHLRPKPMIEIGDRPILWHIMKYYSSFGFHDFVICCGYKAEVIKRYFTDYYLYSSDITVNMGDGGEVTVHNNIAEPWRVTMVDTGLHTMTGGRVRRVRDYVGDERFLLTYGDGVADIDLRALLATHEAAGTVVTLTAVQPSARFGMLKFGEGGKIVAFKEKLPEESDWVNGGYMVMEPEVFDYLEGDDTILEQEPLARLAAEGKLGAYKHTGFWQCMDTLREKQQLEKYIEEGSAPWIVW